jgi:putative phosphoribosyl transferase
MTTEEVDIVCVGAGGGSVHLPGTLTLPDDPSGLVLFAHGSGSSRHSPRNRFVARQLHERGLGTLLFDLLTAEEAADRANVFDVSLLADRVLAAVAMVQRLRKTGHLPIGLFGASTGAAAALMASVRTPQIKAVVARGGRPDLAEHCLAEVTAPTLLVVGGEDRDVLVLNREASDVLGCEKQLAVIPRATHLFEEPGTLEEVAWLAADWFSRSLRPSLLTGA